ncbi:hypothetical protein [Bradyrhizobium sp. LHD-71]|uniref:hypothetical protein n=1 Tax=Bradyrhizobium sp. LHD-71 TaxID=3072141 RepID=UPI00280E4D31|nr:hypothetical protein [Bradyrhizobium sp. LHD-71]MDQ8729007.1 hypothetical protein [Bradyrhizobium sp. LHD-71]
MQVNRRALPLAGLAAICLAVCVSSPANAFLDTVPPFKGNDTGGIIAWTLAGEIDARRLAVDHCARYGKLTKRLATQRRYGGYISFACVWPRAERPIHVLRVRY